jgi:hypothetical protein
MARRADKTVSLWIDGKKVAIPRVALPVATNRLTREEKARG